MPRELDFTRPVLNKQDRMKEYNKKYREEHSNIVHCTCGGTFKEISKYTHTKTARHQDFLLRKVNGGGVECLGKLES